jgi:hypothetical protein
MATPLDTYLIPGGAQESFSERRESRTFRYTGVAVTLKAACPGGVWPVVGAAWGDTPGVISVSDPLILGVSGHVLLTVQVDATFADGSGTLGTGTLSETSFELETATVYRPLLEHPGFNAGGSNPLTYADHLALGFWQAEGNYTLREAYKFTDSTGTERTLSTNAQRAARYIAAGVQQYADMAPVARRTRKYSGGPPPSSGNAGLKQSFFGGFPGGNPDSTLEWLNSGERGLRSAGTRDWFQTTELMGATKILLDRESLYLT